MAPCEALPHSGPALCRQVPQEGEALSRSTWLRAPSAWLGWAAADGPGYPRIQSTDSRPRACVDTRPVGRRGGVGPMATTQSWARGATVLGLDSHDLYDASCHDWTATIGPMLPRIPTGRVST